MEFLKHTADRTDLGNKQSGGFQFQKLQVTRQEELAFEFCKRAEADWNKAAKFDVAHTATSLSQVRRDGDRCTTHL